MKLLVSCILSVFALIFSINADALVSNILSLRSVNRCCWHLNAAHHHHLESILVARASRSAQLCNNGTQNSPPLGPKKIKVRICSLERYKNIYGDLWVPRNFTFEDEKGCLGYHVFRIRRTAKYQPDLLQLQDKDKLNTMGFVLDVSVDAGERLLLALHTYKEIFAKDEKVFRVPQSFVVPQNNELWPASIWGIKLGLAVKNADIGCYKGYQDKFHDMGLRNQRVLRESAADILLALLIFKHYLNVSLVSASASFTVPDKFIIPTGDVRWPTMMWGMKLGKCVSGIRYQGSYRSYHDQFRALGLKMERKQKLCKYSTGISTPFFTLKSMLTNLYR